jgi:hypothetical protein
MRSQGVSSAASGILDQGAVHHTLLKRFAQLCLNNQALLGLSGAELWQVCW